MFEVKGDPARNLVLIRLSGFMDVAAAHAYMDQIRDTVASLPGGRGRHVVLTDAREAPLQSQQVMAILAARGAHIPAALKSAVVTGQSSFRMQVRRVTKSNMMAFETLAEAENWLFAPDQQDSLPALRRAAG